MNKLYPYPAVQYIPLAFGILFRQENIAIRPLILIGKEITDQQEFIAENFGVQLPTYQESANQLLLLAGGFEPLEVKYRGYYVTIKATLNSVLNLISLPKHYFYKDTIVFQAKNENGDLLVSKSSQVPTTRRLKASY